jgi:hypothetical protein
MLISAGLASIYLALTFLLKQSTMFVIELLMIGAVGAVVKEVNKAIESHKERTAQRQREFEQSLEQARGQTYTVPEGYKPQIALLGRYKLKDDEYLIATFAFEPCEWWRTLGKKTSHPVGCGYVAGIGHVTNERVLLFYDLEKTLGRRKMGHLTGEVVEWTAGMSLSHRKNSPF